VVTFFAEHVGSNDDWFFGAYDYTDALGPRLGGVPLLVMVVWDGDARHGPWSGELRRTSRSASTKHDAPVPPRSTRPSRDPTFDR
jgi:hypothetical protein